MSFTLADGLSPKPNIVEMADFWEVECLKKADFSASLLDISKALGIIDDVQEDEADEYEEQLEEEQQELVAEIERRIKSCSGKYPFKLNDTEYVLSINNSVQIQWQWLYVYLLLATRNNMKNNKIISNIDGTEIFEMVSKDILNNYLGGHSKGIVFGTATGGGFKSKLTTLVSEIKDGILVNISSLPVSPQDDKLDVVVWIPFNDNLSSKLTCFAQCKTGTHWEKEINQLDVGDFLKKWFSQAPKLNPVRTFMIADIVPKDEYYYKIGQNLFLDRLRIAHYFVVNENNGWYDNLKTWTQGVMNQFSLSLSAA